MATTLLEPMLEPAVFDDCSPQAAAIRELSGTLEPDLADPTPQLQGSGDNPGSIAAYYSLAFPNFTYYLQTLEVTIGRRLATGTSEDVKSVDVDLGPLKSVSRLHAKITYDDEEELWVLDIYGRNGAWVDGAWSGPGSRVPLESRSQIQIASRTFSFILPPSDPPDDSPLTSSPTSTSRPRSPSLDAPSFSPASSPVSIASPTPPDPEHTAEPEIVQHAKPKLVRKRAASDSDHDISVTPAPPPESKQPPLPDPDSEGPLSPTPPPQPAPAPVKATKPAAGTSKAKAKPKAAPAAAKPPSAPTPESVADSASVSAPTPAPVFVPPPVRPAYVRLPGEPEPQKPAATLSQLCYRAIKALDGRATLQSILGWIMDTYEWYRAHSGEKWESSVRHNLSSNAAFVKSRRNSNEPGKGAFWTIDPAHVESFEAVETKLSAGPPVKQPPKPKTAGKTPAMATVPPKVKKEANGAPPYPLLVPVPMMPPGAPPGAVPPPAAAGKAVKAAPQPLMSNKPLASPFTTKPLPNKPIASPFTKRPLQFKAGPPPVPPHSSVPQLPRPSAAAPAQPVVKQEAVAATLPKAAVPASAPSTSTSAATDPVMHVPIVVGPLPASYPLAAGTEPPPIALHEGSLILSPKAFAHLTPDEIKEFEKLGPQKALAALQVHVVKFLKEQMRSRGRGRGRGRGAPGRGGGGRGGAPPAPKSTDVVMADATSTSTDVTMRDATNTPPVAAETPEESTATASRSQSQVRPRSNSAEAADVPPPKRARVDSAAAVPAAL